jgi:thymidylate synthase
MHILRAKNVHMILPYAMGHLKHLGTPAPSRNGAVLQLWEPVATIYENPEQRVIFHEWRDANPFFHFYESLWMLSGRRDVSPLTRYVKRMASFSDDGETFNAAYGHRWRAARAWTGEDHPSYAHSWERDQLLEIAQLLKKDHTTRQCVLQIWNHELDLGTKTKDHACNIAVTFQIDPDDVLNMVVFCRSNDIIWGCYGANAVHFSMLHEYMARRIGVLVGTYTQISVNWHAYREVFDPMFEKMTQLDVDISTTDLGMIIRQNPYDTDVEAYPLSDGILDSTWDEDCRHFVTDDGKLPTKYGYKNPFFVEVAWPIVRAHDIYKDHRDIGTAIAALDECQATDWRKACHEWLERRRQ